MSMEKSLSNSKHCNFSDAFGQVLWDYYKENKHISSHVIERDDGNIDVPRSFDMQMYFSDFKDWPKIEKAAIKFVNGSVLDVGCGAGRHCIYLQKKNHDVIGLDNSPLAIKISKLSGVKQTKVLSFKDVGKLKLLMFDTILMFRNNFGLFGNFKKARKLLSILYNITTQNGLIIATTLNPYKTKSREHKEYHKLNRKRNRMGGQATIRIRYKKLIGPWFDYLLVSQTELKHILAGTGWKIKKIFTEKGSPTYRMILRKI